MKEHKSFYLRVNVFSAEHLLGTLSKSNWNLKVLALTKEEKTLSKLFSVFPKFQFSKESVIFMLFVRR